MIICWYCYWGWPRAVRDLYDEAVRDLGGDDFALEFGPAHVVWADENFDTASIDGCLERCAAGDARFTPAELAVVRHSLERLRELPEAVRCPAPADYDGVHPENYPPPARMEMVKP